MASQGMHAHSCTVTVLLLGAYACGATGAGRVAAARDNGQVTSRWWCMNTNYYGKPIEIRPWLRALSLRDFILVAGVLVVTRFVIRARVCFPSLNSIAR